MSVLGISILLVFVEIAAVVYSSLTTDIRNPERRSAFEFRSPPPSLNLAFEFRADNATREASAVEKTDGVIGGSGWNDSRSRITAEDDDDRKSERVSEQEGSKKERRGSNELASWHQASAELRNVAKTKIERDSEGAPNWGVKRAAASAEDVVDVSQWPLAIRSSSRAYEDTVRGEVVPTPVEDTVVKVDRRFDLDLEKKPIGAKESSTTVAFVVDDYATKAGPGDDVLNGIGGRYSEIGESAENSAFISESDRIEADRTLRGDGRESNRDRGEKISLAPSSGGLGVAHPRQSDGIFQPRPTNGTTVVYRGTTFSPIVPEELYGKTAHSIEYLPLLLGGTDWRTSEGRTGTSTFEPSSEERAEPREEDAIEAADFGMRAMNDLYYIEEPRLFSKGLFLGVDEPGHFVAAFNGQLEEARQLAKFGYAALEGAKLFVDRYPEISREAPLIASRGTRRTALHRQCPKRGIPQCPPASLRYRTADGSCNNPRELWWGSAMSTMQRFLPPIYHDGVQSIRRSTTGKPLPSAREVSSFIHEDRDVPLASVTHMLMQWGQFVDHDITATGQSRGFNGTVPRCCLPRGAGFQPLESTHPECLPIPVSPKDPFYARLGVRCLEFVRSGPAPREDCGFGPREQLSQVTSFLDASTVYSSDASHSDSLRIFRNGLLQYGKIQSRKPLLPRERDSDICRRGSLSSSCFRAGDGRLTEQPALTSLHVVFLRQHNRLATQLAAINPHWSDEKLFQESRRIVGALVQHITYREFLPIVLGREVTKLFDLDVLRKGYYDGYDPTANPSIANAFSTAAYRFGHSLVQHSFLRYDEDHRPISNNVSIHDEFANPANLHTAGSVDRLLLGLVNQPSQKRDEYIVDELTQHLFQTPSFPFGMDLASLNIQRGRDHGLPPYVEWRVPCGLSPVRHWDDLKRVMPLPVARKFELLYASVRDIDLFPAGLAEKPVIGGLVGPTFACIIAQQFSNLRRGDRFWYENPNRESSFTVSQLRQIRRATLAQILCKTMDSIDTIQPFVFLTADTFGNDRLSCDSEFIGNLDLTPWAERPDGRTNDSPGSASPRRNRRKASDGTRHSTAFGRVTAASARSTMTVDRASYFPRPSRPIKTNIRQHNKISVKRPLGSHENLTIVVQNNAINSPVFVNDVVSGTNFQLSQHITHDVLDATTQRPSPQAIPQGPVELPTRPKPISYGGIRPQIRPSRPYIPHSFDDPSNPNPPSFGFSPKPTNDYVPHNVFFDNFFTAETTTTTTTPRPTLYTFYTTFDSKPKPTASRPPRPDVHQNVPLYAGEIFSRPTGVDAVAGAWSPTRPHYDAMPPKRPAIHTGHGWTHDSYHDVVLYEDRPSQGDGDYSDGWTSDHATYSADTFSATGRPDHSRPQYWFTTTTKRYTSTKPHGYYDSDVQIYNGQGNIDPRPLKTQSIAIVAESDESVHHSGISRYQTSQNEDQIIAELPRPLFTQRKDVTIELPDRRAEFKRPGQYYYENNALLKYPVEIGIRSTINDDSYRGITEALANDSVSIGERATGDQMSQLSSANDSTGIVTISQDDEGNDDDDDDEDCYTEDGTGTFKSGGVYPEGIESVMPIPNGLNQQRNKSTAKMPDVTTDASTAGVARGELPRPIKLKQPVATRTVP